MVVFFLSGLEVAKATLGCGHGEEKERKKKKLDFGRTQGFWSKSPFWDLVGPYK